MLHRIYGGVCFPGRKRATAALHSVPMGEPPERVALAVTVPQVAVGDRVLLGERVCAPQGSKGAVHASVSGRVAAIEPQVQLDGREALCVVIENDGQDSPARLGVRAPAETPPGALEVSQIRAAVAWAGIAGMGGAAFPTGIKLGKARGKVHTLIVNGCEGESYLTADHRLMLERTEDVLTGTRLLARALGLERACIAIESNKYDAITALRALLPLRGGDVEVRVLPTRYPQGSERQLIQRLAGEEVPAGVFPLDRGYAVFNVATAAAVTDAVYGGKPVTHRIITVTGGAVRAPKNLIVPVGTPISDLIREAGGFSGHAERVVAGGGMMGLAQRDLSAPVTQGTGAVVAMKRGELGPAGGAEGPCIRCGRCLEVCPLRLEPMYFSLCVRAGDDRALARLRIGDCMECGACAYACPARIRLAEDIKVGKRRLRAGGASGEEADHGAAE